MTDSPYRRRRARRMAGLTISLIVIGGAYWYAQSLRSGDGQLLVAPSVPPTPAATAPAGQNFPAPGRPDPIRTSFPPDVTVLSDAEIVAALSDHTAMLDGGFVEYYAPDGKLHGMVEAKHSGGSWAVRNGAFCTLLQDSSDSICSPVGRAGDTLFWSLDGGRQATPVITVPGNVKGLN